MGFRGSHVTLRFSCYRQEWQQDQSRFATGTLGSN